MTDGDKGIPGKCMPKTIGTLNCSEVARRWPSMSYKPGIGREECQRENKDLRMR
jgi:hypothetical protein